MDIETMPHAMYFTGDPNTAIKINQVPYQTIEYIDNGMFTTKLMNDTPIKILSIMVLHLPFYHYVHITNFPFYTHTLKPKVTLLYIQEEA